MRKIQQTLTRIALICTILISVLKLNAQTTLQQGDVSIIGWGSNTSPSDDRSIGLLTWVPLSTGTVIKFTTNTFKSNTVGSNATNNANTSGGQVMSFTVTSPISPGSVIKIAGLLNLSSGIPTVTCTTGSGTVALAASGTGGNGSSFALSSNGRAIFIYQGADWDVTGASTATFFGNLLYGLTYRGGDLWLTSGTATTSRSYKPADLPTTGTFGNLALDGFNASARCGYYIGATSGFSSLNAAKSAVNNIANWTSNTLSSTIANTSFISGFTVPNISPSFTSAVNTLSVCKNSTATSINSLLTISDFDAGQTETWSVSSAPTRGTLGGFNASASSGNSVTPTGLTYIPTSGYSGTDAFTIAVSDGYGGFVSKTITVTVKATSISSTPVTVCNTALPYTWNGTTYSAAGTYVKTLTNAVGCDSLATLVLTVKASTTSTNNVSICPSALPYSWNGSRASVGTYTYTTINSVGCDSIATLLLTIKETSSSSTIVYVKPGQLPYNWNGVSYNTTGTYTKNFIAGSSNGCDSLATLNLMLLKQVTSNSQWTWLGADTSSYLGVYGRIVSDPIQQTPGKRSASVNWKDASGNLWLFGGLGWGAQESTNPAPLNDLWKYDVSRNNWTWMSGDSLINGTGVYGTKNVSSASNKPVSRRGGHSWADGNGNLWLFGGEAVVGFGYVPYTGGPGGTSNVAPIIYGALNDLWKYNTSSGQWTWVSGDNTANKKSVYGTKNVSSANNKPSARTAGVSWLDANNNLWLFGGRTIISYTVNSYSGTPVKDSTPVYGSLNDLWKFDIVAGQWVWVSGDTTVNQNGVYGTKGTYTTSNKPGSRLGCVGWRDTNNGGLWLYGGSGYSSSGGSGFLNDLWRFDINSGQWSWVNGDSAINSKAAYSSLGASNSNNKPGSRTGSTSWKDANGDLWLFGGQGYGASIGGTLNDLWKYNTSSGQWVWISGDSIVNQVGNYGTKGVASASNKVGARSSSNGWIDETGNLWLFGGSLYSVNGCQICSYGNDLWKYSLSTGQWTWVGGNTSLLVGVYGRIVSDPIQQTPGKRSASVNWKDASGNLWLFGGLGWGAQESTNPAPLNDLWKYDVSRNNWTWMSGDSLINDTGVYGTKNVSSASNKPVSRRGGHSWADGNGNLWLFGGEAVVGFGYVPYTGGHGGTSNVAPIIYGALNDLWKYNTSSGQWTWVSGDNTANKKSVYGTKNVSSANNKPSARTAGVSWLDANNNLWLFGGRTIISYTINSYTIIGYGGQSVKDSTPVYGSLNDLWKFDIAAGQWVWVSGDTTVNQNGVYGTKGTYTTSNKPGSRLGCVGWSDSNNSGLWLYGGSGYSSIGGSGFLNDLWRFDISSGQWSWVNGDNVVNSKAAYSSLGASNSNNKPGSRTGSTSWKDANGDLWLFGGQGYGASIGGTLNDLWKYNTSSGQWVWISGDSIVNQVGNYGTKGVASASNKVGARSSSNGWIDETGNLWLFGGSLYSVNGCQTCSYGNDLWKLSTYCSLTSSTLTLVNCGSYTWNGVTYTESGKYTKTGLTNAVGCDSVATLNLTVNQSPTAVISASGPTTFCSGGSVGLSVPYIGGKAINLNATDRVTIPHNTIFNFASQLTIEMWVKTTDGIERYLTTKGEDSWYVAINFGKIGFWLNNAGNGWLFSAQTVNDGYWHHIACTFDGNNKRIYIDGVLSNTMAATGSVITTGTSPVEIGSRQNGSVYGGYFNGSIDEIRFWNIARTGTQIQSGMSVPVLASSTGLVAYYKLDEGSGTNTVNGVNGANTATLSNNSSWIASTAPIGYSSYLWSPGAATTNSITANTAGNKTVTITDIYGCTGTASQLVTVKTATTSTTNLNINQLPYSWNGLTFNAAGTQTAHLSNVAGCDSAATLTLSVTASTVAFNLKAMLQGLYLGNGKMIAAPYSADGFSPMSIADTITVELRDTTQFNVIYTIKGLLDTAGNANISFPSSVNGNSYYIVVGHRNSIAVWSANPVTFSATTNYDFTDAITKAFGNNMSDDGNGVFMLFSGDINQDGSIDFNDYPDLDFSSSNGDLGYLLYDLNGDASVDFNDYPLIDFNSNIGVIKLTP